MWIGLDGLDSTMKASTPKTPCGAKQEHKVSLDAHCHRHRRKDPRITKDCKELMQSFPHTASL